jgi:hypothetical protein
MVLYGKYPLEWRFYMGKIMENHGNIWGYPAWLCQTKSELENGPLIVGLTVQDGDFL